MKNQTEKIIAGLTAVLALLVWSALVAQGQPVPIPDCCTQAITYKQQLEQMTSKYNESVSLLQQTRLAGRDLIQEKDARIKALQDQANAKLTTASGRERQVGQALVESNGQIKELRSELESELLRTRLLGWGRKRWIKSVLEKF
ncbi:hypothetical protein GCM10028825_02450 [Spirosoma agri]